MWWVVAPPQTPSRKIPRDRRKWFIPAPTRADVLVPFGVFFGKRHAHLLLRYGGLLGRCCAPSQPQRLHIAVLLVAFRVQSIRAENIERQTRFLGFGAVGGTSEEVHDPRTTKLAILFVLVRRDVSWDLWLILGQFQRCFFARVFGIGK